MRLDCGRNIALHNKRTSRPGSVMAVHDVCTFASRFGPTWSRSGSYEGRPRRVPSGEMSTNDSSYKSLLTGVQKLE